MEEKIKLQPLDKIEILTLQDNYVEVTAMDNSEVVKRATAIQDNKIQRSISAEHGFSAVVRAHGSSGVRTLLFDFGFSEKGAAENAKRLGVDMTEVEAMVLSHGHSDHTGGIETLTGMIGKKGIELFLHPGAFRSSRHLKFPGGLSLRFPNLPGNGWRRRASGLSHPNGPASCSTGPFSTWGRSRGRPISSAACPTLSAGKRG